MLGFAEELEFLSSVPDVELDPFGGRAVVEAMMLRPAKAPADYYIEQAAIDGIPYWDTGAPKLAELGYYVHKPSDPFNDCEPVDSSAASVAAQALWRLGGFLLWQSAHSEFYFCDAYWPAFRKVDFLRALRSYAGRHRRYGN